MVRLTTGDARQMAGEDLYRMLEKVVNNLSRLTRPYWVLVVVRNHYQGPAPFKEADGDVQVETRDVVLPDKLIHNRIIAPLFSPPVVRQLGTMLWRVDNRKGETKLVYSLPMDVPTFVEDSDNAGTIVGAVAQAAQGIPLLDS